MSEQNIKYAQEILTQLVAQGMQECVVCPGARSAPIVALLSKAKGLKVYSHFEERSAAFFALGRMKVSGKPVAVITTSGTAAAELLPATIEAYYSGLPLVVLTADRPKHFRGTGSPQTIDQLSFFKAYVELQYDLEPGNQFSFSSWTKQFPLQVNVCFSEPLLKGEVDTYIFEAPKQNQEKQSQLSMQKQDERKNISHDEAKNIFLDFLSRVKRPLVIVSALPAESIASVRRFCFLLNAPVYLEASSGLRADAKLSLCELKSGERILKEVNPDAVIRIGTVPTTRFWRDLELGLKNLPVFSLSEHPFTGLARESTLLCGNFVQLLKDLRFDSCAQNFSELFERDESKAKACEALLKTFPQSEPALMASLSQHIPDGSQVYVGNSLPIRMWDFVATREKNFGQVFSNRGANGIDGQLSSFYGCSSPEKENWAILGDLTSMYDLAAPYILPQLPAVKTRLVVMNNQGGKIFTRMFKNAAFENRHHFGFEHVAKQWNMDYISCNIIPETFPDAQHLLIELQPDEVETAQFWEAYSELWG
ncbi:MAG: 2-succinyl-5-enolpyruvyl-6-hydroxy-3-cyclohexene-1-carboxylic-acid synthase [Deltaproteobacteria bacterium CG_4_10_14_0_2_um_filter_43_8]|nr:MAG: 2-succinyl-5-enolpyruvyl-6-hydroxy-3-cyclohexene-1-carboxylic-acid synthase [Deltaproteobacteria bacterium CG_4_10_14_0_2_um_filter_43_8]PJC64784.1 MAG: 2-succinyl-5-enolpyruvyl-6-hydroxy-3-cyclohexene-1-carboxylic-acid synthase [Deltaproteobacteria bacterium CG_4_9_14_0_2_um_filter_42_21]